MKSGTVYVVHTVMEDLSAAKEFGSLHPITGGYVYPDQLTGSSGQEVPADVFNKLSEAANQFDQLTDYLLLVGDHVQVAMLCALLGARCGWFRVLRYDRHAKGYIPVIVGAEL